MSHAVRGLLDSGCVDRIVVAGPARHCADRPPPGHGDDRVVIVTDGPDSGDGAALRSAFSTAAPGPDDVVLVHDVTRAFVPAAVVAAVVGAVRAGAPAAVPVEPVADTVKVVDTGGLVRGTRDRSMLRHAQAPVATGSDVLGELLTGDGGPAGAADLIPRLEGRARTVPGDPHGRSIRSLFDVAVIEALQTTENTT